MKIIVKPPGCIEHKGKTYLPGEPLDVPKEEAERLINKGKAEPAKPEKEKEEAPEKGK